jgi:hypothetical protein
MNGYKGPKGAPPNPPSGGSRIKPPPAGRPVVLDPPPTTTRRGRLVLLLGWLIATEADNDPINQGFADAFREFGVPMSQLAADLAEVLAEETYRARVGS